MLKCFSSAHKMLMLFYIIWNVASVRENDISLRKWSVWSGGTAHLRTLKENIVAHPLDDFICFVKAEVASCNLLIANDLPNGAMKFVLTNYIRGKNCCNFRDRAFLFMDSPCLSCWVRRIHSR